MHIQLRFGRHLERVSDSCKQTCCRIGPLYMLRPNPAISSWKLSRDAQKESVIEDRKMIPKPGNSIPKDSVPRSSSGKLRISLHSSESKQQLCLDVLAADAENTEHLQGHLQLGPPADLTHYLTSRATSMLVTHAPVRCRGKTTPGCNSPLKITFNVTRAIVHATQACTMQKWSLQITYIVEPTQ
jgi:hypothetical protein